ncbi:MAG: helix-turn-helix transcriptional regulator [Alphaproteobacteria bacterium]|nr:helix-turn-helix transcriptional regulator [Alphaproteobacteria bacterium]
MSKTIPFKEMANEWKKNTEYKKEYKNLEAEFEIARELIHARARAHLTQMEVAKRMGTTQSAVARLESGTKSISLRSLEKYAEATGSHLHVRLTV